VNIPNIDFLLGPWNISEGAGSFGSEVRESENFEAKLDFDPLQPRFVNERAGRMNKQISSSR
jgi:hypothetical protein